MPTKEPPKKTRQQKRQHYQEIRPNPGRQTQILSTSADIAVIGGAAGGGKTFGLLLEATRHIHNPRFGAVFFRRTSVEITQEGGAWDKSEEIYYGMGAIPNLGRMKWYFPSGATVTFAHMQHEKNVRNWLSSQMALILIDQAEGFSAKMFWGLVFRNRSDIGVRPYMRLACNPDPDSFLAELVAWWIDQDTGFPIMDRSGIVRYFVRDDGEGIHWADSPEKLKSINPKAKPISFTFIPSFLDDNEPLKKADPDYESKLDAMPFVDRMRFKWGNWKIRVGIGMFQRDWFLLAADGPTVAVRVRCWDTAATEGGGAFTAGVLLAKDVYGRVFVEDVVMAQVAGARRKNLIRQTAELDRVQYGHVVYWKEQEPGGGGKSEAEDFIRDLIGFEAYTEPETKNKVLRAGPWSSWCEAGNVFVLIRPWTEAFLAEHAAFPMSPFKDQVDAAAKAYQKIADMTISEGTGVYVAPGQTIAGGIDRSAFQ